MSDVNRGERFIESLLTNVSEQPVSCENEDIPDDEEFDDDKSCFTTESVDEDTLGDIYGHPEMSPTDDHVIEPTNLATENSASHGTTSPPNIQLAASERIATESDNQPNNKQKPTPSPTAENDPTIPKTRSLAHHQFEANKVVFVSFDIETGGEYCGILQMSAEIVRLKVIPKLIESGKNKSNHSWVCDMLVRYFDTPGCSLWV